MHKFTLLLVVLLWWTGSGVAQTVQLVLGNPSGAVANVSRPDNFLVVHEGFVLSYNRSRGVPNWVTWHLQASDLGRVDRPSRFRVDRALPAAWRITHDDYTRSDHDRGHMCPSKDRSSSAEVNRGTFIMSNVQPQVGTFNGGVWRVFEEYLQREVDIGQEAYITAGCTGNRGRIKGKVTIPTRCWKIAVLLPLGSNDLARMNRGTRVIAVDMPNRADAESGWRNHLTTVDDIERMTGYDFLNTVSENIQEILESTLDNQ